VPLSAEVPCKTLSELPRNVKANVLALKAVNKKWRKLPGDVLNLVAQNMSRATLSAVAMRKAFKLDDDWFFEPLLVHHRCNLHESPNVNQSSKFIEWEIELQTGIARSDQVWYGLTHKYTMRRLELNICNHSTQICHTIDMRSEYETRRNPKPHIMLADGRRLLM